MAPKLQQRLLQQSTPHEASSFVRVYKNIAKVKLDRGSCIILRISAAFPEKLSYICMLVGLCVDDKLVKTGHCVCGSSSMNRAPR